MKDLDLLNQYRLSRSMLQERFSDVRVHNKTDPVWFTLCVIFELSVHPPLVSPRRKNKNLSNGNQLDVTESLSPDWQENGPE